MDLETLSLLPPWDWPADAAEALILDGLSNGADPSERQMAADLAGRFGVYGDALARVLIEIVRDPAEPSPLRERAALALGTVLQEVEWTGFDDPYDPPPCSEAVVSEIRASLAAVYRDAEAPLDTRRRALEASVRSPERWHAGAVRAAYHDADPAWKVTAVFCMQYVGGFNEEIVEALSSDDRAVVREAVTAAGSMGAVEAWPMLRELLLDRGTDRLTLLAALVASTSMDADWEELAEALEPLLDSPDEEISEAAMEASFEYQLWADLAEMEGDLEDD